MRQQQSRTEKKDKNETRTQTRSSAAIEIIKIIKQKYKPTSIVDHGNGITGFFLNKNNQQQFFFKNINVMMSHKSL
jgi:beta-lactam-binding protein with PASTA domain